MRTLRIWGVERGDLRSLAFAALIAAGGELAGLALLSTAAWLLLRAAEQPPIAALTVAIVAVRTLALLRGTLRYAERLAGHRVVLRYLGSLRTRVYESLVPHRNQAHGGDLLARAVSDVDAMQDAVLRCVLPALVAAGTGLVTVIVVAFASPVAALVLAAGLALAGIGLPMLSARITGAAARDRAPSHAELAAHTVELVRGADELAVFGARERALGNANRVADRLARQDKRSAARVSALGAAGMVLQFGTALAVCLLAADLAGPTIAALTLGTIGVFEVALPLTGAAARWAEASASLRRVHDLLTAPAPRPGPRQTPEEPVRVVATGLGVRYPGREEHALSGLDLDLPYGKRIALVGPSGSGKSTVLHALLGLVEPSAGGVTVNGVALGAFAPEALAPVISGALADAHVFHTTVRENLLLAKPSATDAELRAACATAGLGDWPDGLPAGLGTVLGADGAAVSGGQRQRLVLARAMLANPQVLLLDEPVEGLEPATGDAVLRSVLAEARGTVVLATHRLAPLADERAFDEIVVLDNGKVIQRGSHRELVNVQGYYADRWRAEASLVSAAARR
ncbi:thiol reductant ABC exporter subunit CydC [Amycolatopsis taiwanensis]|uniref:thiol reductant ABC exporter subunit CydC n=1 Tax=Amycolatopsis taiwanensis TaxID=342230 RepID=UPI0004B640CA|nr:thiol reductant ABC exporter subunit CydC [Amycolatopsis taiwanensis]